MVGTNNFRDRGIYINGKQPSRPTSLFFETKFFLLSCFLTPFLWTGASRPQKLHALLHP